MLNSQAMMRGAVCATLVALCVVGAKLFLSSSIVEREVEPAALHGTAALEQLKQTGQYESLQSAMQKARLSVSRMDNSPLGRDAWRAPNPSAGYDAYVTEAGVSIALNDQTYVSLRLQSIGFGSELQQVAPGEVSGHQQTIEIKRDGLREWFVNGPEGLEHGFTLDERPQSAIRNPQSALRLALQVGDGWRVTANEDGQSVTLHGGNNQLINYGKLAVQDQQGRAVPARLTVADEQVVIEVEDREAAYPLTIDPLFTLQKQLLANDGADFDLFGYAVSLDGNTAIVGAPYDEVTHTDQGSVYVFVRSGANWTFQQKLFAADGQPGDKFGSALAISGDTALIGAPEDDEGSDLEIGSAYVFVRSGTTWSFQQKLGASGGFAGALFGAAVALDGNTALVGAYQQTITPSFDNLGAAYIFVRNGATWTPQQRLLPNDAADNDRFGFSVALDGDTALIGAPSKSITATTQGAAYIFTRSGTVWTQQPRLNLNSTQAQGGDQLGSVVSLSGDYAAIGVPLRGADDRGAAVLAKREAAGWTLAQLFEAPNPSPGAHFGAGVAMDGGLLVVGASLGVNATGVDQRTAYVYSYTGDTAFIRQLGAEVGNADDRFGYAVAVKGDTALVGAYRADAAAIDQGAAYVFTLHDSQHAAQPKLLANDGAAGDLFGSVAMSGDTVAVGASRDDIGTKADQGSVYVFVRTGGGWTFQQQITANDGAANDHFGHDVSLSGNTLAVGADNAKIGANAAQGAAYVFVRNGTIWTLQQKLYEAGIDGLPSDYFGNALALEGDTLAVGASGQNYQRGAAYVFTRTGTIWTQQPPKLLAPDGASSDLFGVAVALSGDTVVVGAPFAKIGTQTLQGAAYVFTRNNSIWAFQRKLTASDGATANYFGQAVALYGNTAAIGAPGNVGTNTNQGAVYVFTRSGTAPNVIWTQEPRLTADDGSLGDLLGSAVALSGDTLVAGAYGRNGIQGAAYVFTRLGSWRQQQRLTASDGQVLDRFGNAVALSGNTIVIGAPYDDNGTNIDQGSFYTFVAPGCPALTLNPASLPNGAVGAAYNQSFNVSGGRVSENFILTLSGGALPPGLVLDDGLVGTPTTPGTYRFTVMMRSSLSLCPAVRSYTLTITSPCASININPVTLPDGRAGEIYSQAFTVTGGSGAYNFTISAGVLPNGLSLSPSGLLSGAPMAFGDFNFNVRATDASGCTGLRAYSLHINQPCGTLILNPASLPEGTVGAVYNQTVTATGGTAPYAFTVSAGTLPNGLSLAANGALTGTPNTSGGFNFTVKVTDTNGCVGTRAYSVGINGLAANNGLQYYPLPRPIRLFDTRAPIQGFPACAYLSQPLTAGQELERSAHISCDNITIPSNARAIVGNVTVTGGQANGFITIWPGGQQRPPVSNLNFVVGQTVPNAFTVGLSSDGKFRMYSPATTDLIVDIVGYYAPPGTGGLYYHPLPRPIRLFDTRAPIPGFPACAYLSQPLIAGQELERNAHISCDNLTIPNDAMALVGNVTATGATGNGFLSMWPSGQSRPAVSSLNFVAGQSVPNAFTVGLSSDGKFKLYATHATDLIIDIAGYYSSSPVDANGNGLLYTPLDKPIRLFDTRAPIQGFPACQYLNSPLVAGVEAEHQARVNCDGLTIPTSALAIVGNATVTSPAGNGYVTLWPNGQARPPVSNLNYVGGQTIPNAFTVGLGSDGKFRVVSVSNTHFILDVTGYFAP
ncbi:MAG: putative Ig domain-containing protein [Blastocatellales bacterium]